MEDQDAHATKGDIAAVKQDIEQLRSEMNHGYRDLAEKLDDGITRMMTAFYGVAETQGKRLTELDNGEALIRSRLNTVESRLMEVEKRLHMPPATN